MRRDKPFSLCGKEIMRRGNPSLLRCIERKQRGVNLHLVVFKGMRGVWTLLVWPCQKEWMRRGQAPLVWCVGQVGWVQPTPFVYKHIENEWGGIKPTPFLSKPVENNRVGFNPPRSHPNMPKMSGVGLNPPCSCQNWSKTNGVGFNPPCLCPNALKTSGKGFNSTPLWPDVIFRNRFEIKWISRHTLNACMFLALFSSVLRHVASVDGGGDGWCLIDGMAVSGMPDGCQVLMMPPDPTPAITQTRQWHVFCVHWPPVRERWVFEGPSLKKVWFLSFLTICYWLSYFWHVRSGPTASTCQQLGQQEGRSANKKGGVGSSSLSGTFFSSFFSF